MDCQRASIDRQACGPLLRVWTDARRDNSKRGDDVASLFRIPSYSSLAGYVAGPGPRDAAIAAGGCPEGPKVAYALADRTDVDARRLHARQHLPHPAIDLGGGVGQLRRARLGADVDRDDAGAPG